MFFTPMHPGKQSERFAHMGKNDHHQTGSPENRRKELAVFRIEKNPAAPIQSTDAGTIAISALSKVAFTASDQTYHGHGDVDSSALGGDAGLNPRPVQLHNPIQGNIT